VFGKADSSNIDAEHLGAGGFRIDGAEPAYGGGLTVAGAGDFDGDGLADLLLGQEATDFADRLDSGSAVVVFGKRDGASIDLASLGGAAGFVIGGAAEHDATGNSVDQTGDVNGDGRGDLIVAALFSEGVFPPDQYYTGGAAYLIYGRPPPA